jgi:hypothetical protein
MSRLGQRGIAGPRQGLKHGYVAAISAQVVLDPGDQVLSGEARAGDAAPFELQQPLLADPFRQVDGDLPFLKRQLQEMAGQRIPVCELLFDKRQRFFAE